MSFNITVKRKFKINGKEYNSMEEMPDDIRDKFKKMMDSLADSGNQENPTVLQKKIVFNAVLGAAETPAVSPTIGLTKPSSDKRRKLGAFGTVHSDHISQTKVEPSFSMRMLILGVILGALLILLYYFLYS